MDFHQKSRNMERTFTIFLWAQLILYIQSADNIYFLKTLDGEEFNINLIPSLERNVSYIQAIDPRNNQITYSLDSPYFTVNSKGQVFLIAYLDQESSNYVNYINVEIQASTDYQTTSITSTLSIIDVNDNPPEIVSTKRIFEIVEDNAYPSTIGYGDGTDIQIHFHDPDSANTNIFVSCENTLRYPNVCDSFMFNRIASKSTSNDWFGTIQVLKKLNYLEQSIFQLIAVVQDNSSNLKRFVFEIRVLPNMNKAPILSRNSYLFTTPEKEKFHVIGKLSLVDEYDLNLKSDALFQLVLNPNELTNSVIQDFADVDFKLVNNFIEITADNEIKTKNSVDRDSPEFTEKNGILKFWIRVFFKTNQNAVNFYKITIIFTDLNDHAPSLAIADVNAITNTDTQSYINQELVFNINENEIGPIIFEFDNAAKVLSRSLISYDLDLAENGTFIFFLAESQAAANKLRLPIEELNYYFGFGPTIFNSTVSNFAVSKTSVNLMNVKALDFDNLPLSSFFDEFTGIGRKIIQFMIGVKECSTEKLLPSNLQPVSIVVHDLNDNKPEFSKSTYYASIEKIEANFQKVLDFQVTDKDSGDYGLAGLVCELFGNEAEKFVVDSAQQSIYLKRTCTTDCSDYYKSLYNFNLICRDNKGNGHTSVSTIILSFQQTLVSSCFTLQHKNYYLLATGSSSTDIPSLIIKVNNPDISNKITYQIQDPSMREFFFVDFYGNFKLISPKLTVSNSKNQDGIFLVDVLITVPNGCSATVTVTVQLSKIITKGRCPQIADQALCHFSINKTNFDPNQIRFCFYAVDRPAYNLDPDPLDQFNSKIYYSLLPTSPDYLYINKFDGCVKISSAFNLDSTSIKHIQYSVGVFNPGYPDCKYTSQRSCLINILNPNLQDLKCVQDFSVSDDNKEFLLQVNNPDSNSKLEYSIVKEERVTFNGQSRIYSNNFFYKINAASGMIQSDFSQANNQYSSILVTLGVRDVFQLSSSTKCIVEFRFNQQTNSKIPQFIGSSLRREEICEDIPVNSLITKLNAFDPGLTNQSLCFPIEQNDYFRLQNDTYNIFNLSSTNSNGIVILKKTLIDYNRINMNRLLNFTATLYYCHQSSKLSTQLVTFKVLNVNKYAPRVVPPSGEISLTPVANSNIMYSEPFDIIDSDLSPYDKFKCFIENDKRFSLVYDNFKRKVTVNLVNRATVYDEEFVDVAIKCCDDPDHWNENKCFSVPKCSVIPIRVKLTNIATPVFCSNNEQSLIVSENSPISLEVFKFQCTSNNTNKDITYRLLDNSNYFTVNSTTGIVSVIQSLKYKKINLQRLQVQCNNGMSTSQCQLDVRVVPDVDISPEWLYPNTTWFQECVVVGQDVYLMHDSLVTEIQAYSPDLSKVEYFFVNGGHLKKYIHEFKIETLNSYGRITLNANINRRENLFREMTLAASITIGNQKTVTTYQYLCIKIFAINSEKPCFQNTPTGLKWPYHAVVKNNQDQCFSDQLLKVNNKNKLDTRVYYYLIAPQGNLDNPLFKHFEIDILKGIVCFYNRQSNFNLVFNIINSSLSYEDPTVFNQMCVDLPILATESILNQADRRGIAYDAKNCSFNYFKVCTLKPDDNYPPVFIDKPCQKVIALDNLYPVEASCLHEFDYIHPPNSHGRKFKYELVSLNNQFDYNMFYINQTNDCLSLQQFNGINKKFLLGLHQMKITSRDEFRRSDTTICDIYITGSCEERVSVYTTYDIEHVRVFIEKYLTRLSYVATNLLNKQINAINTGIYTYPIDYPANISETFISVSFHDVERNRFLGGNEVLEKLSTNLNTLQLRELKITKVQSSCPVYPAGNCVLIQLGVGLWTPILAFMLVLVLLLLCFLLCYSFKVLKYQNNRIIMKQSVIPILEDCQSNFMVNQFNEEFPCGQINEVINPQVLSGGEESSHNLDAIKEELPVNRFNQELLEAIRQRPGKLTTVNKGELPNISKIYENYQTKLTQNLEEIKQETIDQNSNRSEHRTKY